MALNFTPKPGKPHIKIISSREVDPRFYIWPSYYQEEKDLRDKARSYCIRVNPSEYKTPGEAARALHYGSEKK